MTGTARLSRILYPTGDVAGLMAFYEQAFGLVLKFQDGDRYAEFAKAEVSLALVAQGEAVAGDSPAVSIATDDVGAALEAVRAAGGTVVSGPEEGPHEIRAVVTDPAGNAVVVYSSLPKPVGG